MGWPGSFRGSSYSLSRAVNSHFSTLAPMPILPGPFDPAAVVSSSARGPNSRCTYGKPHPGETSFQHSPFPSQARALLVSSCPQLPSRYSNSPALRLISVGKRILGEARTCPKVERLMNRETRINHVKMTLAMLPLLTINL